VGWGKSLQARRKWFRFPVVSLEFFIGIILPAALWAWDRLSLWQKWVPGILPGNYHVRKPIVLKSGSLQLLEPSAPVQADTGIKLYIYIYIKLCIYILFIYFYTFTINVFTALAIRNATYMRCVYAKVTL
jgi:hypothetical protein